MLTNIIIGFLGLALIGGGFYYYFYNGTSSELTNAKTKVQIETAKLNELDTRYNAERVAIAQIKEQYLALRNGVIKRTDIFFNNSESNNPTILLKIKDKTVEKDINNRRLEITKLLKLWDKKIKDLDSGLISESTMTLSAIIAEAKNDFKYVDQYIIKLRTIVSELNPTNSQLQQTQIYVYENIIEASINQVGQLVSNINSIETTIESIYLAISLGTTTPPSNTNSNPSQNTPTTPTVVTPPLVTLSQIQAQEEIVSQAEEEQALIEQGVTPPPPPNPEPYVYYPVSSQSGGSQTIIEYLQSLPSPNIDRSGWPDRSIDNTSGKPLLLDGSDQDQ